MDPRDHSKAAPGVAPFAQGGEGTLACDCEALLGPDGPMPLTGVTHVRFAGLTAALMDRLRPSHVIAPLFSPDHDATAVIERLGELGYSGRITILAPPLPRPALVERELRALGPGARLTLVSPGGSRT